MGAWNGWYHVIGNTYGTWLPGDPRGWREKRHRRHVPGDYRNPPLEGFGDALLASSRRQMKGHAARLAPAHRQTVGEAIVRKLRQHGVMVLVISVDAIHFHLLAKFPDANVRRRIGNAKLHAYYCLKPQRGDGKLWTGLCHVEPVRSRSHQLKALSYICNHARKGAWVWTFRDPAPPPAPV